jgi:hypothetical protein
MTPELIAKIGKVLAMLASPHDTEKLAAAGRFAAILEAHNIHVSQVFDGSGSGPVLTEEQMRQIYDEGYQRGHADGVQEARPACDWTPADNTKAEVGDDAARLQTILDAAAKSRDDDLLSEWEVQFSDDMRERFAKHRDRLYISERQWSALDRLETKLRRQDYID